MFFTPFHSAARGVWYRDMVAASDDDGPPHGARFRFGGTLARQNPRRANGSARNRIRAIWKARGENCAICGRPIDYSLGMVTDPRTGRRRPHPASFVVDEIVPVSKGGDPFSVANTRPAHWACNARRGDGTRKGGPTALPLPQPWDLRETPPEAT